MPHPLRLPPLPRSLALCAIVLSAPFARPLAAAESAPPIPPVIAVEDLGLVKENPAVNCRDGTYSAVVAGKPVWTFNDTCLNKGGVLGDQFIDNTLAWSTSFDASNGIHLDRDLKDSQGVPVRFVPFTEREIAFNEQHAPNELAIWPGQIVADPERKRALIFFGTVYRGGDIGFRGVGSGIAVASLDLKKVTRPVQSLDPDAPEPTYMWGKNEQAYTGGYVRVGDMLYCYGGEGRFLSTLIHVARVPLADVLDKTKWTYYAGKGEWSTDPKASKSVYVGGAAGDTIFWNEYLGMYVAVYMPFLSNDVYYRVAWRPEGPWSEQALLFIAKQGTDPSYAGRVHTEYAQNAGQIQYVSYVRNKGFLSQDLPLVKVTFGQPKAR